MKNKKIYLIISISLVAIFGSITYFLFFSKCPYNIGTNLRGWMFQPCPYVIKGKIIDKVAGNAVDDAVLFFGEEQTRTSATGEFVMQFRGELNKAVVTKEGYNGQEVNFLVSNSNREVNLETIVLEPETRIVGKVIDWLSEQPISDVSLSFSKGDIKSSAEGTFVIKTDKEINRTDLSKISISKNGYLSKEIDVPLGEEDKEIDLGKIELAHEGRVVYQRGNSIFNANLDGSESNKLADGILMTVAPTYDKFVFKTKDSALRLMDISGNTQMKFAYQNPQSSRPSFPMFSLNGNIFAWISSYEVQGPQSKSRQEEIIYFNFEEDKQDGARQLFKDIHTFRISPDGKYIATVGVSFQDKDKLFLEDIVKHQPVLEINNPYKYFFDEENFYYNILNSGWYIYHFSSGATESLTSEPSWWDSKFEGIINPYTKNNTAFLQPGWAIKLADITGSNAKRIVEIEPPQGYLKNLQWGPNENYLLFETSNPSSLWVLDINSGKYKKITDLFPLAPTPTPTPTPPPTPSPTPSPSPSPIANSECDYQKGKYEMRIYDSEGRVTGLVNGEIKTEVPNTDFDEEMGILILDPEANYTYEIYDLEEGNYVMTASNIDATYGNNQFMATNIPISPGQTHKYQIDWAALATGEKGGTLNIDADKDKQFEKTVQIGKTLTCEEFLSLTK